jgi:Domain of unknown function (DUF4389)
VRWNTLSDADVEQRLGDFLVCGCKRLSCMRVAHHSVLSRRIARAQRIAEFGVVDIRGGTIAESAAHRSARSSVMQPEVPSYPVRIRADLDPEVSRWQWLVKWILAIPHYIVLFFLHIAYVVITLIALFAILFTGRYPRGLFDFNVGVLRWRWRVVFYALYQLGTDKYPPFSLQPKPEYPADLEVDYPERLHRGLVLIKWWLLAIPHYLVLIALYSGGMQYMGGDDNQWAGAFLIPVIGVLLLIAVVGLLFTGRYPKGVYDFVAGINRWAIRVRAYASLMRDEYPPFRLDMGPREPQLAPAPGGTAG